MATTTANFGAVAADTAPDLPPNTQRLRSPSATLSSGPSPPTSPEVISSLISSLSAISAPAENHFNKFPIIDDTARRSSSSLNVDVARSTSGPPTKTGFGMDYGAYSKASDVDEDSLMVTNDVAAPPVVRLAKLSASASSLAPARTTSPARLGLKGSQQSLRPRDSVVSNGMLPGDIPARGSSASISSSTRSSLIRTLMKTRSRDDSEDDKNLIPDPNAKSPEGLGLNILGRAARTLRTTASNRSLSDGRRKEVIIEGTIVRAGTGSPSQNMSSPNMGSSSPIDSISSSGVGNICVIPSRRSSLRHSFNGSPVSSLRRSGHKRASTGSKDLRDLDIDPQLIKEDDQTVRRIRELQEAKEKREKQMRIDARRAEKAGSRHSRSNQQSPERTVSQQETPPSMSSILENVTDQPSDPLLSSTFTLAKLRNMNQVRNIDAPPNVAAAVAATSSRGVSPDGTSQSNTSARVKPNSRPTSFLKLSTSSNHQASSGITPGLDRSGSIDAIDDAVGTYLKSPRLTQKVRHPYTGRTIAFSEVGDPNGFAVVCCVGMGLTRYLTAFYDELARTLKLRLITPDRPGIGESEPCLDGTGTPMNWPDDVGIICDHLGITKFSLLAHSAGAIYALATALCLPQRVRGRIHLMAPWIPPSQMTSVGKSRAQPTPTTNVPYTQKLLRILPASFLKAANSSLFSATSASLTLTKSPRSQSLKSRSASPAALEPPFSNGGSSIAGYRNCASPTPASKISNSTSRDESSFSGPLPHGIGAQNSTSVDTAARQSTYDDRLTQRIWDLATTNANPAVDLLICLERRQSIGFKYVDVTRSIVIHHGSRDTRVPIENVRWLGKIMRRCEIRVLEGEGHGLMASAKVMAALLGEVAKEWEDWSTVTQKKKVREKETNRNASVLSESGH